MCYVAIIMAAVAVVASVAQNVSANRAASAQAKALTQQNQLKADQISDAEGQQVDERARAARKERAAARVSASESGINLGSNSFLAMLQTSEVNQGIDSGLILHNEANLQKQRQTDYASYMSQIHMKTGLGIALDASAAGLQAYSGAGGKMYMGNQPGAG
jgi:hypothetical protein